MPKAHGQTLALKKLEDIERFERETADMALQEAARLKEDRAKAVEAAQHALEDALALWSASMAHGPIDPYLLGGVSALLDARRTTLTKARASDQDAAEAATRARSALALADARLAHAGRLVRRSARRAARKSEEARYLDLELTFANRSGAAP